MSVHENKRVTIVNLLHAGKSASEIFELLKKSGYKRPTIYYAIKRYYETGTIKDRPRSGRPRSARTRELARNLRSRIQRNPQRSLRKLAAQMETSHMTVKRTLKYDLGMKPYHTRKAQFLSARIKRLRKERAKALLERFTDQDVRYIMFSDEKLFTMEEKANPQNKRVYAARLEDIPDAVRHVQTTQHPGSVMVWASVSMQGKPKLHFVEPGVKINAEYYRREILEGMVKPAGHALFGEAKWCFQQDSAPSHKAKSNQRWCETHLPDFISVQDWPSSSPDLNPLDYFVWSRLEQMVNSKTYRDLDSLKHALETAWRKFPQEELCAAIGQWRTRLKRCVKAKGGHIEL